MNGSLQPLPPDPLREVRILKRIVQIGVYLGIAGYLVPFRVLLDMSTPQLMGPLIAGLIIATVAIEGAFWQMFRLRKQSAYPHLMALQLSAAQDLSQACHLAIRLTGHWLRGQAVVLGWVQEPGSLLPVASHGLPADWQYCAPPLSEDQPLLEAIRSAQPVIVPAAESPTYSHLFGRRHHVAYVPLTPRDRVVAVLCIVANGSNADLHDRKLLQSIGIVIGLSLENMRLNHRQYESIMQVLCGALDMRDSATQGHSQRVAQMARRVAQQLGLSSTEVRKVEQAAALHDIGKIGVADAILCKPGPLSEGEWVQMRRHPGLGFQILSDVEGLREVAEIVHSHHERYDGKGYPRGLKAEDIPQGARIFSVVDSYDAMTTHRPYRRARSHSEAIEELTRCSGTQFDPTVVAAFLEIERLGLVRPHDLDYGDTSPQAAPAIVFAPGD